MRPIHLVSFDKVRPALVLTRDTSRDRMRRVTVAQITSRVHGLPVEVEVGAANGLDRPSVINLDSVYTLTWDRIGHQIGWLLDEQEPALANAVAYAFALELPED